MIGFLKRAINYNILESFSFQSFSIFLDLLGPVAVKIYCRLSKMNKMWGLVYYNLPLSDGVFTRRHVACLDKSMIDLVCVSGSFDYSQVFGGIYIVTGQVVKVEMVALFCWTNGRLLVEGSMFWRGLCSWASYWWSLNFPEGSRHKWLKTNEQSRCVIVLMPSNGILWFP